MEPGLSSACRLLVLERLLLPSKGAIPKIGGRVGRSDIPLGMLADADAPVR